MIRRVLTLVLLPLVAVFSLGLPTVVHSCLASGEVVRSWFSASPDCPMPEQPTVKSCCQPAAEAHVCHQSRPEKPGDTHPACCEESSDWFLLSAPKVVDAGLVLLIPNFSLAVHTGIAHPVVVQGPWASITRHPDPPERWHSFSNARRLAALQVCRC